MGILNKISKKKSVLLFACYFNAQCTYIAIYIYPHTGTSKPLSKYNTYFFNLNIHLYIRIPESCLSSYTAPPHLVFLLLEQRIQHFWSLHGQPQHDWNWQIQLDSTLSDCHMQMLILFTSYRYRFYILENIENIQEQHLIQKGSKFS